MSNMYHMYHDKWMPKYYYSCVPTSVPTLFTKSLDKNKLVYEVPSMHQLKHQQTVKFQFEQQPF